MTTTFFDRGYSLYPDVAQEGLIDSSIPNDVIALANTSLSATEVRLITMGTVANSTLYTAVFSSTALGLAPTTVSFTSGGSATAAQIRDAMIAAINGSLNLSRFFRATATGNNVTVTSRIEGAAGVFNISVSGGGAGFAPSVVTAGADSPVIPFGRLIWSRLTDPANGCRMFDGALNLGLVRGFSTRTDSNETNLNGSMGYANKFPVNILQKGRINVVAVTAMTIGDPLHFYISGENQGRVRNTADGGLTVQYTGDGISVYKSFPAGFGKLEVNLP